MSRKTLLDRLNAGEVIVGDGGIIFAMEKRGYVLAGRWTPEVSVEHPEAVRQLHREFLRAGSDVIQPFTFFSSSTARNDDGLQVTTEQINSSACEIATDLVRDNSAHIVGSLSQTYEHRTGLPKEQLKAIYREQAQTFVKYKVEMLLCEYFSSVTAALVAVEVCKEFDLPVAVSLCVGPEGDEDNIRAGDCAVKLAEAGVDVIGVNCRVGPFVSLETIRLMKDALEKKNLKPHLMCQPTGFLTPDAKRLGYIGLPEFPFAIEPRICTRMEIAKFARMAYNLGVRYIGGCCGFEAYHIRAISEELFEERGFYPPASEKHKPWGGALAYSPYQCVRERASRSYWENLNPTCGRDCRKITNSS